MVSDNKEPVQGRLFDTGPDVLLSPYYERLLSSLREVGIGFGDDDPIHYARLKASDGILEHAEADEESDLITFNEIKQRQERWHYRDANSAEPLDEAQGFIVGCESIAVSGHVELAIRITDLALDPESFPRLVLLPKLISVAIIQPEASQEMIRTEIQEEAERVKPSIVFEQELKQSWDDAFVKYNLENPEFRTVWTYQDGTNKT